jgi:hypothetical protein
MESIPPRAEVTVYSPLFSPFRQPLQGEAVSIGRASDCSIPIKDRYLSRKHAEIIAVGNAWMLKDLGSANGTYLNGSRVERDEILKTGDRIRLSDTEIVFETSSASTDRFFAIANDGAGTSPTIAIPVRDISDKPEEQDVARLHTLTLLARELIEDRPMDELFGFITERIMEHLHPSRAAIALLGPDGRSFTKVEVRRHDPTDVSELTISHTLLAAVVEEKKALAFVDVSVDEKLRSAKSIIMQGIHSILCAPLLIGEAVVGVMYVDYLFTQRSISEEDVKLVAQIGRFAAIKLETTRLREEAIQKRIMDEELKTASGIQRRLLPAAPTNVPGFTFVGRNQPCRTVSGDYYDFAVRPDGRVLRHRRRERQGRHRGPDDGRPPGRVPHLREDRSRPCRARDAAQRHAQRESPAVEVRHALPRRLDTNTGMIEYERGSYAATVAEQQRRGRGHQSDLLLGVVSRAEFTTRRLQLAPGDSLILFTDGVTEVATARASTSAPR